MKSLTKNLLPLLLATSVYGTANASIIAVVTESTANGAYWDILNEAGLDPVNFNNPQIAEEYGSRELGSAGTFDSISDVDGGDILFKNGNASFGAQAISSSRTVVDITFKNTGAEAVIPILKSQILPAGMGFFLSDCTAENIRNCQTNDDIDFGFDDITSLNGPGGAAMGAMFDFKVMAGDSLLYSLTGSMSLMIGDGGPNTIVTDFSEVEGVLNGFQQTSPLDSLQQLTFDWGATDFDVIFPDELLPDASATVSYITEVSTFTNAFCVQVGAPACAVAYASFGDPIGRGGSTRPRTAEASSGALAAMASDTTINGYEAGLYRMALPTFENGVLTYRANSGPGIGATSVSTPNSFAFMILGVAFLALRRKRNLQ
jgi:hypothetical protein